MKSWTPEQDEALKRLYDEVPSFRKWKNITLELEKIGIKKTQYQCRERYINKLDPDVCNSEWSNDELRKIFSLYNEYGSQWSLIQKCLPGRTQNSIKNKFYCTIRNFLRSLFRCQGKPNGKSLVQLSSKKLTDLYEGKKQYRKFKGFLKRVFKAFDYKVTQSKLEELAAQEPKKIAELYELIFQEKPKQRSDQPKKVGKTIEVQSSFKKYVPEKESPSIVIAEAQRREKAMNKDFKLSNVEIPFEGLKPPTFYTAEGLNSSNSSQMEQEDLVYESEGVSIDSSCKQSKEKTYHNTHAMELSSFDLGQLNFMAMLLFGGMDPQNLFTQRSEKTQ